MNVKPKEPYEVIKLEPNVAGQTEGNYCASTKQQKIINIHNDHDYGLVFGDSDDSDDIFSEFETEQSQTWNSLNSDEIKQEIFESEESKIEYRSWDLPTTNDKEQLFSVTIKKEPPDIPDVVVEKQEVSGNKQAKIESELLTSCDLPTLKSESDKYLTNLVQLCSSKHARRTLKRLKTMVNVPKRTRRQYPCAVCQKDSFSSKSRSKHMDRHFGKTCVVCEFCGKFVTNIDFFRHHFIHSVQNRRRKISLKINDVSNAQQYEIVHASEKPLCSNEFNYESNLQHLIIHFDKKQTFQPFHLWEYLKESGGSFKCEICSKKFKRKTSIDKHLISHTSDKPFQCDICTKQFKHKHHLRDHLRNVHSDNRPFQCDICYKTFKQKFSLNIHLKKNHSYDRPFKYDSPFKCDVCFKQFIGKYDLIKHSREVHCSDRPFKCDICSKKFKRKKDINRHLLIHTGEKPFKCNICPEKFTRKYFLRDHLETIHLDNRQLKCDICSNQFEFKREHLKNHSCVRFMMADRSFKCYICSKNFNRKCYLNAHLKNTHSDNRLFKCDICSKQFKSKYYIRNHLKTVHSDNRPYECDICSKQYKHKHHLNDHFQTAHSDNKPYECDICSKHFKLKHYLREHLKKHSL